MGTVGAILIVAGAIGYIFITIQMADKAQYRYYYEPSFTDAFIQWLSNFAMITGLALCLRRAIGLETIGKIFAWLFFAVLAAIFGLIGLAVFLIIALTMAGVNSSKKSGQYITKRYSGSMKKCSKCEREYDCDYSSCPFCGNRV